MRVRIECGSEHTQPVIHTFTSLTLLIHLRPDSHVPPSFAASRSPAHYRAGENANFFTPEFECARDSLRSFLKAFVNMLTDDWDAGLPPKLPPLSPPPQPDPSCRAALWPRGEGGRGVIRVSLLFFGFPSIDWDGRGGRCAAALGLGGAPPLGRVTLPADIAAPGGSLGLVGGTACWTFWFCDTSGTLEETCGRI